MRFLGVNGYVYSSENDVWYIDTKTKKFMWQYSERNVPEGRDAWFYSGELTEDGEVVVLSVMKMAKDFGPDGVRKKDWDILWIDRRGQLLSRDPATEYKDDESYNRPEIEGLDGRAIWIDRKNHYQVYRYEGEAGE